MKNQTRDLTTFLMVESHDSTPQDHSTGLKLEMKMSGDVHPQPLMEEAVVLHSSFLCKTHKMKMAQDVCHLSIHQNTSTQMYKMLL